MKSQYCYVISINRVVYNLILYTEHMGYDINNRTLFIEALYYVILYQNVLLSLEYV